MYNSLSNIQKHLYSLIKQNNPEYLQQSINEDGVLRSRRPNLANLKVGERLADFEGMDQQQMGISANCSYTYLIKRSLQMFKSICRDCFSISIKMIGYFMRSAAMVSTRGSSPWI